MNLGRSGLGVSGRPMAGHLLAGRHGLVLQSRSGVPRRERPDAGGTACASPRGVAERAEVVFALLPDTAEGEAVPSGPAGVAEGVEPDRTVAETGSNAPGLRVALHQKDLGLALDDSRQFGPAPPAAAPAQQLFPASAARVHGAWNLSAPVTAPEARAGCGTAAGSRENKTA